MNTISETIDGSIKDIIQLKTVDNSLEYSQMFDALEDCPDGFKSKLIGALNSLGETMETDPCDAFNKVLCASDDENAKKKLYNWWKAVFEVVGKSEGNIPKDRLGEYEEKVDALVAEICKAGDKAGDNNEVVLEDGTEPVNEMWDSLKYGSRQLTPKEKTKPKYKKGDILYSTYGDRCRVVGSPKWDKFHGWEYEVWVMDGGNTITCYDEDKLSPKKPAYESYEPADLEDEDKLKEGMQFAISKLGEVANKAQELVNFLNPYCNVDDFNEDNNMKKLNERGDTDWVPMDKIVGMEVGESDDGESFWRADDMVAGLEKKGYWSGKFKVGDEVCWVDPETGRVTCGWKVVVAPEPDDDGEIPEDGIYVIAKDDGSEAEVYGKELRPRTVKEAAGEPLDEYEFIDLMKDEDVGDVFEVYDGTPMGDGSVCLNVIVNKDDTDNEEVKAEFGDWVEQYGWRYESFSFSSDLVGDEGTETINVYFRPIEKKVDESDLENELNAGDDGWKEIGQPVSEAKVTVDANDVWDVLDLLDDETANKHLTDLINSHVRSEEEIMDAIDSYVERYWSGKITKQGLVEIFTKYMYEIVNSLGLDVEKFKRDGQFVEPEKPVTLEGSDDEQKPDEVKDGDTKFKIGDYVSGMGLRGMVVKVFPRPSGQRQRYLVKCMHGRDKGRSADLFEDELTFRHSGNGDENIRSATLVSYGIFDVDNLMKFLKGLKPKGKRGEIPYEIVDVKAESDEIVKVTFRTRGSNKDIHSIIAKDYIAYDIENWKISDISEPVEDKEHPGMFQTEVTLKMEYDMRGKRASSMELESDTEGKTPDEIKDGDKKYKQDGETKTLVTGSEKKVVSEMTIEQEVDDPWKLVNLLWGQGKENFQELLDSNLFGDDTIMSTLEQFEIRNLGTLNDFLAFEFENFLEALGCDREAWVQHLEITRGGSEEVDEASKKKVASKDPMIAKIEETIPVDAKDGLIEIRPDRFSSYLAVYAPGSEPEMVAATKALSKAFPDYYVGYDSNTVAIWPKKRV